jgi:hypothetical protein
MFNFSSDTLFGTNYISDHKDPSEFFYKLNIIDVDLKKMSKIKLTNVHSCINFLPNNQQLSWLFTLY